jgi:pimeloyl-ACP methyl ester carboxylesterase/DNA-binding CsgD family transcriptional regulator
MARVVAGGGRRTQEQVIGFLLHEGTHVAFAVTGSGPLLLFDVGRAHHLEVFWRHPAYRLLVQRLSQRFTVVRWDRPGFGLSDRRGADLSLEGDRALVERLVTHLGAERAAILAAGDGGPGMLRFAASHPDRVSRLALFGTAADGRALLRELPSAALEPLSGASAPAIHEVVATALARGSGAELSSWLAGALQASADVSQMAALIAAGGGGDATDDAALVRAPALVLHRAGDTVTDPQLGRQLAARIPHAAFAPVEGQSHLVYGGDTDLLLASLLPFLTEGVEGAPKPLSERELEVAQMVTLGLTNAEIGRRLAIRRRTVDSHLEHIRAKLGVRSRARIASWTVYNEPATGARRGARV